MKIILLEDVKKHGKKGEIIEVKDGFGINYLVKNKLGVVANTVSLSKLEKEKQEKQSKENEKRKQALEIKDEIEKEILTFYLKSGEKGKTFGSVSSKQIEEALKKYNIDKRKIRINNSISSFGQYIVDIELYKNVLAQIKINIVKEGE